jgi:hypothetical protein
MSKSMSKMSKSELYALAKQQKEELMTASLFNNSLEEENEKLKELNQRFCKKLSQLDDNWALSDSDSDSSDSDSSDSDSSDSDSEMASSPSWCPHCSNTYTNNDIESGRVVPCPRCYKCFVGDCGITSCDCVPSISDSESESE